MSQPDFLVFMTDQHNPLASSFSGGPARSPNMEQLCRDGVNFNAAYTSCPLCVPARISMLLGKLPGKTGVFGNDGAIAESSATFLHSLVAVGYETVLIGRMHFVGTNQRHGFTKRLVGDMTPVTWNRPAEKLAEERGVYRMGYAEPGCLKVIGGGDSPVLEYDKAVVQSALDYLAQPHDKPQCIFVSTYGPHFPYAATPELYLDYKSRATVPETWKNQPADLNPLLKNRLIPTDEETVIRARAAYFAMIETIDGQLGSVRAAFDDYLKRQQREGVFAYLSDHGDQAGEHGMFGKMTFYESSARIPLIFAGAGVGEHVVVDTPASIMDLGPTLCELAGTVPPPVQDGISLAAVLHGDVLPSDRAVLSEVMEDRAGPHAVYMGLKGIPNAGRMVRQGRYKLMTYHGYEQQDLLYDVIADPEEKFNLAASEPAVLENLRQIAWQGWEPGQLEQRHDEYQANIKLVKAWEKAVGPDDRERWKDNPEQARIMPIVT